MVKIITDTASDLSLSQTDALGVTLVPLGVTFNGVAYDPLADDEQFSLFYEQLETSKELPVTSQPSPADFLPHFKQAKDDGDDVIAILLSSGVSGTVQSAIVAKDLADYDRVHVIDTKLAAAAERLMVEIAVKMRDEGKTAEEIVEAVTSAASRCKFFAALDTLKYLRKGGRIPKSAEILGSVLNIKPIIGLNDGNVFMAGKARGHAGAVTTLIKQIEEQSNIDTTMPVYVGYAQNEQYGKSFNKLAAGKFHFKEAPLCPVGSIIGTHVGPGAITVSYMVKEEAAEEN